MLNDDANDIEKNIERIISSIDGDVDRLKDTPKRVANAYAEFFSGYDTDIQKIAAVLYESDISDMVILKHIPFESHCEHHVVPIIGTVSVGYIPKGKIIGASKLARIVDCFAHRLQIQERMTMEIANMISLILSPMGVAVYVEAEHFCITHRGVKKLGARLVTKSFLGVVKDNYHLRSEFLADIALK